MRAGEMEDKKKAHAKKKIPRPGKKINPVPVESIGEMSTDEVQKLVHELQVHQIELEMQNEALQRSQMETAESHRKYTDLYDFAPVGYFTFDKRGHIIEANVTGASMLGFEKLSLARQPFHRFIMPAHFSIFLSHLQKASEIKSKQTCKLKLIKRDGSSFDALIETIAVIDGGGKFKHYRSSVADITEMTEAEMARLASFPMLNPNPVAEVDLAGQVYYLNYAAERLFPDLRQRGSEHPWLVDWKSLVHNLREGGEKVSTREVKVDGRWCQQSLHFVEETQLIRIYGMDITELKRAEEVLRESEEKYRIIVETANEGIWITDADRKTILMNQRMADMLGVTIEEMQGRTASDFLDAGQEELARKTREELKTGVKTHREFKFRRKDGSDLWVLSSASPVFDSAGHYSGTVSMLVDITERKKKEEELKGLNRTLKAISDSSKAMMRSTNETEYLHEACRIVVEDCGHAMVWIGYAEDDEGKTVRPAAYAGFEEGYIQKLNVTWTDTERGRGPTGTAIRTGKPSTCRNMLTDPLFKPWREEAIKRGYASSIVFPLMAGGKAFGAVTIYSREPDPFSADEVKLLAELADDLAYGITVIRFRAVYDKAQEELRESEERYRHIVEDSTELIARGTSDGTLTFVNEAWLRNLGRDKSAYIGHNIREFIPPKDQEKIGPIISRFKPERISQEVENRMILPSGESRWYLWNIQAVYDRKGRFIEFQGVGRDITDRKQVEKMLAERTARLEEINRELESFSYSVSHDLRAPLRAIDGYARMILKKQGDKFDEVTMRRFNEIRSSAQMMGQLIDDLLAFSRLGRKQMSMSKIDMDQLVGDVWKELQVIHSGRNMILTVNSIPPGYGDRTLIKQVYFNLLSNAVKFTTYRDAAYIEAGGYTDGNESVYYVKDNGVGFDMTYYDKLFGVFQRLHSAEDFEGTGVGLAIIQRIIHRHGGRVWAEGKVDEGATFCFTLPGKKTV